MPRYQTTSAGTLKDEMQIQRLPVFQFYTHTTANEQKKVSLELLPEFVDTYNKLCDEMTNLLVSKCS